MLVVGREDTSYDSASNDKDRDGYTKLDPFVQRPFRVGGSNVASGCRVVGITRSIRRAIIKRVVAGHSWPSGGIITKGLGKKVRNERRDRSGSERTTRKRFKFKQDNSANDLTQCN